MCQPVSGGGLLPQCILSMSQASFLLTAVAFARGRVVRTQAFVRQSQSDLHERQRKARAAVEALVPQHRRLTKQQVHISSEIGERQQLILSPGIGPAKNGISF